MKAHSFSWMNPKLEVRETDKYGKGVFAVAPLKKGEVVLVAGGYILTNEDEKWFRGRMADKPIGISADFYIGPRTDDDIKLTAQSYINHSCDPNVGIKGSIVFVAMRRIRINEECCVDAAMLSAASPTSTMIFSMKCRCGSRKCRDVITEHDWRLSELQQRYRGFFSWYIQEKIDRLNKRQKRQA